MAFQNLEKDGGAGGSGWGELFVKKNEVHLYQPDYILNLL